MDKGKARSASSQRAGQQVERCFGVAHETQRSSCADT